MKMTRVQLSPEELEIIQGLRHERAIYNQAITDVIQRLTVDGPYSEHAQGDESAAACVKLILSLRK